MWNRRDFLQTSVMAGLALAAGAGSRDPRRSSPLEREGREEEAGDRRTVTLFLGGDVMTGRGIDQVLPHPSDPRIHEPHAESALDYVELAERAHGPIARPVGFSYVWGDALEELARRAPDLRFVNLETSVTTSEDWLPKGINYRMHPRNAPCLTAAGIEGCTLANNHVLDWGERGLVETLATLRQAGIETAGAGRNLAEAAAPATMEVPGTGRVIVFAFGTATSGIPPQWAATDARPGVSLLLDLSEGAADQIARRVWEVKRPGDLVVASIHWGGNWGYRIPERQRTFARALIDRAEVDVVHGHSSHHPKGIEVYQGKPILYGCGDFLNDYEGIGGYEEYRSELLLMYFLTMDPAAGGLVRLGMTPLEVRRFRLRRASQQDAEWLRATLDREGRDLGTRVERTRNGALELRWQP